MGRYWPVSNDKNTQPAQEEHAESMVDGPGAHRRAIRIAICIAIHIYIYSYMHIYTYV